MKNTDLFDYRRSVHFHETDAMGVMHHSAYINIFEESRIGWLRAHGMLDIHAPKGDYVFAVKALSVHYLRPLRFSEEFKCCVSFRLRGVRLVFDYLLYKEEILIAEANTELVPLASRDLKVCRLSKTLRLKLQNLESVS